MGITLILAIYTTSLLYTDEMILCIVFVCVLICMWVLAPLGFHYMYNLDGLLKVYRKGPWDIAIL